eukprot:5435135-Amphidinium_carterae.2
MEWLDGSKAHPVLGNLWIEVHHREQWQASAYPEAPTCCAIKSTTCHCDNPNPHRDRTLASHCSLLDVCEASSALALPDGIGIVSRIKNLSPASQRAMEAESDFQPV